MKRIIYVLAIALLMSSTAFAQKKDKKAKKDKQEGYEFTVVKDNPAINNEEAALQAYHAYLGAYAYNNNADIDYVYCRISAASGAREPIEEEWQATT